MDGGTVWNVNVNSAVTQCMDMGYDQSDIIVDVLVCSYTEWPSEAQSGKTINNIAHAQQVKSANNDESSRVQERAFPDVNYRYYFQDKETDPCGVWDLLDFSNSTTWCL